MNTLRSWPFTLMGAATILLFVLASALQTSAVEGPPLDVFYAILRFLIVPIWYMRYLVVAAGLPLFGAHEFPVLFDILTVPVLLAPYMAADLLFVQPWYRPRPTSSV